MKFLKNHFYPLLILAIPLALTGMLESGVFFFETLFLARLSPDALAAGALVSWLFGTFVVILFGILSAINILVAQKFGAKDTRGISLIVRDGIWLALLFFIPSFLIFWNIPSLFLLLGQSPKVVVLAETYLHALVWGLLPDLIMIALIEIIIGLGHARLILVFSILSVSLNIFFSFALIFGKFGFKALGIAGAGWGTTISYWLSGIILLVYFFSHQDYKKYTQHLFKTTKESHVLELIKIGMPMGIMYCIEVGFFFALTLLMGSLGSELLAANQIALQYMGTLMAIVFSIAQAITVRMGHLLGAHEIASAKRAGYAGIGLSILLMFIVAIGYWAFPTLLISIDLDTTNEANQVIVRFATQFLAICALFQLFEATRIALFGALRGVKDTHFTLLTSIISFWLIALPLGYWWATRWQWGGSGLWWGMVVGAACSVPLLFWRFNLKMKDYS
jgi:MATE family multidrug resistance protein